MQTLAVAADQGFDQCRRPTKRDVLLQTMNEIQKNLRHASLETTAIYLHADDDRRHEATTTPRHAAAPSA